MKNIKFKITKIRYWKEIFEDFKKEEMLIKETAHNIEEFCERELENLKKHNL